GFSSEEGMKRKAKNVSLRYDAAFCTHFPLMRVSRRRRNSRAGEGGRRLRRYDKDGGIGGLNGTQRRGRGLWRRIQILWPRQLRVVPSAAERADKRDSGRHAPAENLRRRAFISE